MHRHRLPQSLPSQCDSMTLCPIAASVFNMVCRSFSNANVQKNPYGKQNIHVFFATSAKKTHRVTKTRCQQPKHAQNRVLKPLQAVSTSSQFPHRQGMFQRSNSDRTTIPENAVSVPSNKTPRAHPTTTFSMFFVSLLKFMPRRITFWPFISKGRA